MFVYNERGPVPPNRINCVDRHKQKKTSFSIRFKLDFPTLLYQINCISLNNIKLYSINS